MLEKDKIQFFDTSTLKNTEGIEKRAEVSYIRKELECRFPDEVFNRIQVSFNDTGRYQAKVSLIEKFFGGGKPIENLPPYYEVELFHKTGDYEEQLIVWSPLAWNDRFAGTAGGGTGIGGRGYLTRPNNTQRGWTVPFAVMNGFSAATMYAGNIEGWNDHTIDSKTGELQQDLYENWRLRSTHNMTMFGKAVTEILHDRPIRYSYMNGGSGGGRQCLMEVQNYPEDYDGVWASCPAINWHKFLMGGYWPEVVMQEQNHFLNAKKNQFFLEAVWNENGGRDKYFHLDTCKEFDPYRYVGTKTKGGIITDKDAAVMKDILDGPRRANGEQMWYGFRPGVQNWQCVIPIGTYYYPLFGHRIKPFALGPIYIRWITNHPKDNFKQMTRQQYETLYDTGLEKFSDNLGDNPAIDAFVERGGKLMIDHGIDDPLIPVDGTLDYLQKVKEHFGGWKALDKFLRVYITPGDNHGNCQGNGPGLTESDGMRALMAWVEDGCVPEEMRKVRVDRKTGETLEEGMEAPFRLEDE
ncbi:tannase/feruloyl esterase family alpha/beta hydrolase [Roseburia sp. NSJ-9]|uniref:Tannase/feruloyl esterase family alpha/beta hydrolase n=1 Tax=Roseburia lenta TaxID=2763061 RepID=A0ABR7GI61_9FIRM|nr:MULTISPECIES: tannase/feruloyl esterase family alpha/beta hydrolase [Roseburia]MBC5686977.1 tannase/feruloyl esterase family alpha/beta hydrolase [Roseburia lenta]RHO29273.1 tannase/feruloyl esterase family alpha/beta hydrolase [Roseburia sp. AM16-25]